MTQNELKQAAAAAAIDDIKPLLLADTVIGVGSGSTVNRFIDLLAGSRHLFRGAVASSEATAKRLRDQGIEVFELNHVGSVSVYVDGADEINHHLQMIKGGGGALTREKIIIACAERVVCIADASKRVQLLGSFALPIEVIPMARSYVARELVKRGFDPVYRDAVITDNGNQILDCHGVMFEDPRHTESELNNIAGVVTNGLFANRPADVLLLAGEDGVTRFTR